MQGLFISLEGLEGCGKTTIAKHLLEWFDNQGYITHHMREPGGTELGEELRDCIIKQRSSAEHDPVPDAELLMFMAGRLQNLERVVKPKLKAGHVIVSERFMDSSYALQGFGRGLLSQVESLDKLYKLKNLPNITFYLKISVEESNKRQHTQGRAQDRIEVAGDSFHQRVADGFEYCVRNDHCDRIIIIDAEQPIEKVKEDICKNLINRMELQSPELTITKKTGTNS